MLFTCNLNFFVYNDTSTELLIRMCKAFYHVNLKNLNSILRFRRIKDYNFDIKIKTDFRLIYNESKNYSIFRIRNKPFPDA